MSQILRYKTGSNAPFILTTDRVGGVLFLVYYLVFLAGLEWLSPGYIGKVWNLESLSGILIYGMPIEELLFAVMFGAYWSGVYEHFTWRRAADIH